MAERSEASRQNSLNLIFASLRSAIFSEIQADKSLVTLPAKVKSIFLIFSIYYVIKDLSIVKLSPG